MRGGGGVGCGARRNAPEMQQRGDTYTYVFRSVVNECGELFPLSPIRGRNSEKVDGGNRPDGERAQMDRDQWLSGAERGAVLAAVKCHL